MRMNNALLIAAVAGAAALAACSSTPAPVDAGLAVCQAEQSRDLIGKHVGAVSFPADANVRIACTTCPTTRDYRPDRMNVLFNEQTGIIEELRCG